MKRLYQNLIIEHFHENRQMLFLMGPRQVGKTTTALSLEDANSQLYYFNWDNENHREIIIKGSKAIAKVAQLSKHTEKKPIIIFDEIHKYANWKNFLKGFYDTYPDQAHMVVTGSARLDVFKKGGDSLMGRYFSYHFHPLSVGEILHTTIPENEIRTIPKQIDNTSFEKLWKFGGYPDPFIKGNTRFFNRWKRLRTHQLIKEDLRDLSQIQELNQLELLTTLLTKQPGQLTSYTSLGNKVRVSDKTIRNWLNTLSSLYYCFTLSPWSKNISRSLLKEPKIYLWDWSLIEDPGMRAENFIASHLLKAVHFWTDYGFGYYALYFLRDKDKREVDFLVTKNDEPWILVEAKLSNNKGISPSLNYFHKALNPPFAFQVVLDMAYVNKSCFTTHKPLIVSAKTFLSQLI